MHPHSWLLKAAGLSAGATALTTLAIHLLPNLWSDLTTFEQALTLSENPVYLARLWVVIVHCLLVVISMYGVAFSGIRGAHTSLLHLGFLGFVVFAFTEILRSSLVIYALNRAWRSGYLHATDVADRVRLRTLIEGFRGLNDAFFFVFFVAFALATLSYGLALMGSEGRLLAWVFLVWAGLSLPTLLDTVSGKDSFSPLFGWVGPGFQPVARAAIGAWLWRHAASSPREGAA